MCDSTKNSCGQCRHSLMIVVNGVGEPRRILHERRKQASFHGEISLTGLIVIKDTTMNISRGLKASRSKKHRSTINRNRNIGQLVSDTNDTLNQATPLARLKVVHESRLQPLTKTVSWCKYSWIFIWVIQQIIKRRIRRDMVCNVMRRTIIDIKDMRFGTGPFAEKWRHTRKYAQLLSNNTKSAKWHGSEGKNSTDRAARKRWCVARERRENKIGSLYKVGENAIKPPKKISRVLETFIKVCKKGKINHTGHFSIQVPDHSRSTKPFSLWESGKHDVDRSM
jgi:hypothetical protein